MLWHILAENHTPRGASSLLDNSRMPTQPGVSPNILVFNRIWPKCDITPKGGFFNHQKTRRINLFEFLSRHLSEYSKFRILSFVRIDFQNIVIRPNLLSEYCHSSESTFRILSFVLNFKTSVPEGDQAKQSLQIKSESI